MDVNKLISDKEATLAILKNDVALLERQLDNLRASLAAASEPTEFEKMLKQRAATAFTGAEIFETPASYSSSASPALKSVDPGQDAFVRTKNLGVRIRNPKGSVERIALAALTEQDQTLDEIEIAINQKAIKPVSRAAVRTLMMYFKRDGKAVSDAPGVFRRAKKGEASTDSRSVEASSATESSSS